MIAQSGSMGKKGDEGMERNQRKHLKKLFFSTLYISAFTFGGFVIITL